MTPSATYRDLSLLSSSTAVDASSGAMTRLEQLAASAGSQESSILLAQHTEAAAESHESKTGDAARGEHEAHAEGDHAAYRMPPEFPNVYTLYEAYTAKDTHGEGHGEGHHVFPFWLNPAFAAFNSLVFLAVIGLVMRKRSVERPGRAQVAVEMLFQGLINFFGDIVGKENARKYVPYVGSLWLFILVSKLAGLVPGLKTPFSEVKSVAALGLCTFLWVNYQAIKAGGIGHYLWHLCGSPQDVVGWCVAPLMFVLEVIGTLIKPVSLTLRLYGNTFGEDKLLASFLGLGMMITALIGHTPSPMIGVPLHFPFMFLGILGSIIQSTVFAMLTAVYIALLLPHDHSHGEEHGDEDHGHEGHGEHGAAKAAHA